jgi:hypothetical protein
VDFLKSQGSSHCLLVFTRSHNNKIIEQVSAFKYLGNTISHYNNDAQLESNIQIYNGMNGIIQRHFGKQMSKETQLRLHNITSKSALRYGSKNWILKQRNRQRLEATQMKFLRPIFGLTRLDKKRNTKIREQLNVINIVQETEDLKKNGLNMLKQCKTTDFLK